MKLGVVYNIYDGLENLKASVESIRPFAHQIELVYGKYQNQAGELEKRQQGIDRLKNCTHVLLLDCDEVFNPQQVDKVIYYIERNNIQATACQMQTYYKYHNVRFAQPETYYIPFIQSIGKLRLNTWDILVDPTRAIPAQKVHIFTRQELEMHHYSHVRDSEASYREKLTHSNANRNFKDRIEDILKDWVNFEPDTHDFSKPVHIPGKGIRKEMLTLVC
jgi:hypothetical protein